MWFFLIKKDVVITEKSYLYGRFFVSNWNFTTEYIKIVKVFQGFSRLKKIQILGFSRFPSKPWWYSKHFF